MRSLLLYNLYPVNNWKELTTYLLRKVPHTHIAINVSLNWIDNLLYRNSILAFLKNIPKVEYVFVSQNSKAVAEVVGFNKFRQEIDFKLYDLATYIHSKGVTKPENVYIREWVEFMRYFQIDKHELCIKAFKEGYGLYGVNFGRYTGGERLYANRISDFHYSGNFVSVNLSLLRDVFLYTPCDNDYYGVEGFWGKLCSYELAFNAHSSSPTISNHYKERYPEELYKNIQ